MLPRLSACRVLLWASVILLGAGVLTAHAQSDPVKCKRALVKEGVKFATAKVKALQKCEEGRVKGQHADPCPDPFGPPGSAGHKAFVAIDKAMAKLDAGIDKQCGGLDRSCGTADDNLDMQVDVGFPATCPDIEGSGCSFLPPIAHCQHVTSCIQCQHMAAVDQAIELYYGSLLPTSPAVQSALNKCQQAIGKETSKFLMAKHKLLAKCWDAFHKGQHVDPCPDASALVGSPARKTDDSIRKAESKKIVKICKACGGADGGCDVGLGVVPGTGGSDDLTPAQIGSFCECPRVTVPPRPYDGTPAVPCAGPVQTLEDLIRCVDCVTEFKVDCMALADAPQLLSYPTECNPAAPTCGNGQLDAGEDCDPFAPAPDDECPNAGNGLEICNPDCTCSCPRLLEFVPDESDPATRLDVGWSGSSHNRALVSEAKLTVTVTGCDFPTRSPACGVCSFTGPVPNTGLGDIRNRRCRGDTATECTADADCGPAGPCTFFAGAPRPAQGGGVAICTLDEVSGSITGTANVETGESASTLELTSHVFLGVTGSIPCPQCLGDATANDGLRGGTCNAGDRVGLACDAHGTHPLIFGETSLDCPPSATLKVGAQATLLDVSTGTESSTLTPASPNCSAFGYTTLKCLCDTCNNANGELCRHDADCPPSGGSPGVCGGPRCLPPSTNLGSPCTASSQCQGGPCAALGEPTQPNACIGSCTPLGPNDGKCLGGPFDSVCSNADFIACFPLGSPCPGGGTCILQPRPCFPDNGTVGSPIEAAGAADPPLADQSMPTLASLTCAPFTSSSAVNVASGLPGPTRAVVRGTARGLPCP